MISSLGLALLALRLAVGSLWYLFSLGSGTRPFSCFLLDPYFSLISLNRLWLHTRVPLQRKLMWLLAASCCKCAVISVLVAFTSSLTWADRTFNDDGGLWGGDSDKLTQSPPTERPMRRWGETRLKGFPHQHGRKWIYKITFMENYIPASSRKSRHVLHIIKPLQSHVIFSC